MDNPGCFGSLVGLCFGPLNRNALCWARFWAKKLEEQNRGVTGAKQAATLQRNPVPRGHDSWELKKTNPTSKGSKRAQCIPENMQACKCIRIPITEKR